MRDFLSEFRTLQKHFMTPPGLGERMISNLQTLYILCHYNFLKNVACYPHAATQDLYERGISPIFSWKECDVDMSVVV